MWHVIVDLDQRVKITGVTNVLKTSDMAIFSLFLRNGWTEDIRALFIQFLHLFKLLLHVFLIHRISRIMFFEHWRFIHLLFSHCWDDKHGLFSCVWVLYYDSSNILLTTLICTCLLLVLLIQKALQNLFKVISLHIVITSIYLFHRLILILFSFYLIIS
jgi:hypothetical protein